MQAYSRTGKQVLKRFKKEPKDAHPSTNKGSAWQRAIKRLDSLSPQRRGLTVKLLETET